MKNFVSVDKFYTTHLTKDQLIQEIANLATQKKYGGLRVDKFITSFGIDGFSIIRKTYGLDGFTLERYPAIEGNFISEKPLTVNLRIRPSYFMIIFLSFSVFAFIPSAIFVDEMTVNGVVKSPTVVDRLTFSLVGGVIPGLWCYFGYIRPVKKAERWIVQLLHLKEDDVSVSY